MRLMRRLNRFGELAHSRQNSSFQDNSLSSPHPNLNRFLLPNGEYVACVFWNGLYHITGTDISELNRANQREQQLTRD